MRNVLGQGSGLVEVMLQVEECSRETDLDMSRALSQWEGGEIAHRVAVTGDLDHTGDGSIELTQVKSHVIFSG